MRNIQWGTNVADINGSSKGEFFSVEELDPVLLLECCLMNEERTKEVDLTGPRKQRNSTSTTMQETAFFTSAPPPRLSFKS